MVAARCRERWNHTASLLALIANCHRDPKKGRILKPGDFHPHQAAAPKRRARPKADITLLKQVFVDRRI